MKMLFEQMINGNKFPLSDELKYNVIRIVTRTCIDGILRCLPYLSADSVDSEHLNFATMRFTTLVDLPTILAIT